MIINRLVGTWYFLLFELFGALVHDLTNCEKYVMLKALKGEVVNGYTFTLFNVVFNMQY